MLVRPVRHALVGVFLLMLAATSAKAEPASPRDLWAQATAAADSGDYKGAERKVGELLETGRNLGIRRFPLFAESAISLARQAYAQKNRDVSTWAETAAMRLDPLSANVRFSAADLARSRGDWGGAFSRALRGFGTLGSSFTTRTLAENDLLIVLCAALATTIALFAAVLFFRYSRAAAHDFRERLGQRFTPGIATVLAYALLLLPLFLWLGPVWLVLYWLALFFGYANKREKGVTIALLVVAALLPLALQWAAYRIAGVDSPVVRAAVASDERSYNPEMLRRLRELVEVIPDDPRLHLLAGNLLMQEGDEAQAAVHYRKAVELNDTLAGVHVNLGNLHFLDNDFVAASTEYQRAEAIDSRMTVAYYNESVAAGELYRYNDQGQKLAEAKKYDSAYVDRLVANPPAQKVAMYNLPIADAWTLAGKVSGRRGSTDVFGNFATFDLATTLLNPLTLGAFAALVAALVMAAMRRRNGFAGSCIKCGRTFCNRCKSSRESAIYCTQCIHIYLKRDGVSIDTKRAKLDEVQAYQSRSVSMRKWLATFFPGSGQLHEGSAVAGSLILLVFLLLVFTALLAGRLAPLAFPAEMMRLLVRSLAAAGAVVVWLIFTIPVYRQRGNN